MIPEDWEVKPLCDIAEIRSGIAKNSKASVSDPILVHYLRVANVQDGFLDLTEMKKIEVSRNDVKHYSVLPGDILMNEGGDLDKLGRGSIWHGEFNPCVHQNHVFVVRSRSSISSEYLNIWTGGASARRYFLVAGKQTTNLATINKTALGQLPVALPPEKEQRAIATALSDVDALIAALDKLIAKKRHLKTATMQQLLTGKKRLPRRMDNGELIIDNDGNPVMFGPSMDNCQLSIDNYQLPKGYKQTEVGVIPEDWDVLALGEIANLERGKFSARPRNDPKFFGGSIPFIQTGDVTKSNGKITSYSQTLNEEGLSVSKLFSKNTLFFTIAANIGDMGVAAFETACPDSLIAILPKTYIDQRWIFHTLRFRKAEFEELATQNAQLNINLEKLNPYLVAVPSFAEQGEIATVLSDMDAEIAALETRRTKTQAIKQGMMQQLLTGKVRLLDKGIVNY